MLKLLALAAILALTSCSTPNQVGHPELVAEVISLDQHNTQYRVTFDDGTSDYYWETRPRDGSPIATFDNGVEVIRVRNFSTSRYTTYRKTAHDGSIKTWVGVKNKKN
jgi:hypothetical protein